MLALPFLWPNPATAASIPFTNRVIQAGITGPIDVHVADIDSDGCPDVLGAIGGASEIDWWRNTDGTGTNWSRHILATNFNNAYSVFTADLDGNGTLDILGAAQSVSDIAWWRNTDGTGTNCTKLIITDSFGGAACVRAADLDGDGNMDVVAAGQNANQVAWWRNTDGSGTNWTQRAILTNLSGAISICVGDLNSDGYPDVAAAANTAGRIAIARNLDGSGLNWNTQIVATAFTGARAVYIADIDGDGHRDIIGAAQSLNEVAWWRNVGGTAMSWAKNGVDTAFADPSAVCAADLDKDGDMDIIGAGQNANQIVWWENLGAGTNWTKRIVDSSFTGARAVVAADLNGDADLDLVGAAQAANSIRWLENIRQYYLDVAPANSYGLVDIPSGWHDGGSWVTVTATPSNGCFFTGWSGDVPAADTNNNPLLIRMTANLTIRAGFQRSSLTITATTGANGSISPSGAVSVPYGASQAFTITPAPGYRIANVLINGASNGVTAVQTFSGVVRDHTLHADFEVGRFFVAVSSLYGAAEPPDGTHTPFNGGDTLNAAISGSPETHGTTQYVCTGWTGSGSVLSFGTGATVTAAITTDSTLNWTWKTQFWFTAAADSHGTVAATNDWRDAGGTAWALAIPDAPHHKFLSWTGDVPPSIAGNNPLTLVMTQPRSITAQFATNETVLSIASAHGTAFPSPGATTGEWGRVEDCFIDGSTVINGSTQHLFSGWTGSGSVPASGTDTNVSVTVTNHSLLTWQWQTWYEFQISAGAGGSVSTTNAWHPAGSNVTVTATPDSGHIFLGWTGDVPLANQGNNPLSLLMSQSRSIAATFVTNEPTLRISAARGTPTPPPGTYPGAYGRTEDCFIDGTTLLDGTARHLFSGWTGSGSAPASGMDTNVSVTVTNYSTLAWNWRTEYQLTAAAHSNGSVSPVTGWYGAGSNALVTATPSNGWLFAEWSGDVPLASRYNNPLTLGMALARSITAHFTTNAPLLTIASDHGTPTPPVGVQTGAAGRAIACFIEGSPEFAGSTQYVCSGWTGSGSVPASGADTNLSVTVNADSTLTWNWEPWFLLQADAGPFGTVSLASNWYPSAASATITAIPDDPHHRFDFWSGDVPSAATNSNPLALAMTQARSLTAHFTTNDTTLSVASAHGTATPAPGVHTGEWNRVVDCFIGGSPEIVGATQYVYTGWTGSGGVPVSGTGTNVSVTVATDSTLTWNWATWHQFQIAAGPGGSVSTTNAWYLSTANITVTATPDSVHQRFDSWSGDVPAANQANNPLVLPMSQARSIVAQFATNQPILTVSSAHGTATPSPGDHTGEWGRVQDCFIDGSTVTEGTTQFVFSGWTGSGSVPASGTDTNVSITVTNHSTLTWNWEPWYRLQASALTNGSVSPTNDWYPSGSNVTVTAVPDPTYRFDSWSGDVPPALAGSASIMLPMTQARTLTASFSTNWVRVVPSVSPSDGRRGGISPATVQTAAPNSTVEFTITPADHSQIAYLVVDGLHVAPTNTYAFTNLIQDHTISAVFVTETFDILVGSTFPDAQTLPPGGLSTYEWNDTVTCRVVNSPITSGVSRLYCMGWTNGTGDMFPSGLSTNAGIITVTTNSSILWLWGTNYWLDTQADPGGSLDTPDGWHGPGSNVTITATPDPGVWFSRWSGDTNGATILSNQITVVMDQTRTVRAHFELTQYVLTVSSLYDGASPAVGVHTNFYTLGFLCAVTNSPVFEGLLSTQYLCAGWIGSGSITNGEGTNCSFTLNADSTIDWTWVTNLHLGTEVAGAGSLDLPSGWHLLNTNVLLTATPDPYHRFAAWSGDTSGCTPTANTLAIPIDQPRQIAASFAPVLAPFGTPEWWMAAFGLTNQPFDVSETNDPDGDRMLTWEEYIADTDPTNALSLLTLTPSFDPAGLAMVWHGATGRLYTVQSTPFITGTPIWTNRPDYTEQPGISGAMAYTNTVISPTPPEYLRLRVRMAD